MKQLFKKPSYYLFSSAMDGNEKAIEKLLAFYESIRSASVMLSHLTFLLYILPLSQRL